MELVDLSKDVKKSLTLGQSASCWRRLLHAGAVCFIKLVDPAASCIHCLL